MELTTFNSPVRIGALIPRRRKASFHENRFIANVKNIRKASSFSLSKCSINKLILPVRIHGESMRNRFSRSSGYGQRKPNSIQASSQVEYTGSDPVPIKIQDESDVVPDRLLSRITRFGFACYNFTRPIAMIQVITKTTSLFARVLVENPRLFKWSLLIKVFPGLVAILLANAYNIGLNQIFDADIDRINKPYLPIAAGDLSLEQAWFLVIFDILFGLLIFRLMKANLVTTALYCLGLLLATSYSAPPFRFKGSSVATSIVLSLLGGVIETVGILYATRTSLGLPFWWSPSIVFVTTLSISHYLAISIMKDLTDVEGDMRNNIRTFTAIYGPRTIAFIGAGILLVNFIGATAAAVYMPWAFKRQAMVPFYLISALWLLYQLRNLDEANYAKEESTNFYVSVWKLNMLGFLFFPFM